MPGREQRAAEREPGGEDAGGGLDELSTLDTLAAFEPPIGEMTGLSARDEALTLSGQDHGRYPGDPDRGGLP